MIKIINLLKENKHYLLFSLFITIIYCLPLFTNKIYNAGDFMFHANRLIGIADCIRDGQIIPRVYPYTNNGYGYASPLFYCDFFLYPFALLQFIGIPFITAYKVMFIFYILLGNILFLVFLRNITTNKWCIYTGLLLYGLSNYRLIDGLSRNAIGELLALTFAPLIMLSFYNILIKKKDSYILLAISFTCILLSHNLSFFLYCILYGILIILFAVFNRNKSALLNMFLTTIKGAILAILLSCWFLFPMLEQIFDQKFWFTEFSKIFDLQKNLLSAKTLFEPYLRLDNQITETPADVNLFGLVLLIVFIYSTIKNKNNKKVFIPSLLSVIFLFCSIGIIPTYLIKQLNILQFSFRWYILILPLSVFACLFTNYNKKSFILILVCSLLNTLFFDYQIITDERFIPTNITKEELYDQNKTNKDYNDLQISGAEYLPVTLYTNYLTETTFIKEYHGEWYNDTIYDYNRYFTKISFEYDNSQEITLMMPLTYYKGYSVKANNSITLETINLDKYHQLGFKTLPGNHSYVVKYHGTNTQKITMIISSTTLVIVLFLTKRNNLCDLNKSK